MSHLMTLIKAPNGDVMLVGSLEGHEDCAVLETGVSEPRVPGCERVDKPDGSGRMWKINKDECRRMIRTAEVRAMSRIELVEMLEAQIRANDEKLASMDDRIAALERSYAGR